MRCAIFTNDCTEDGRLSGLRIAKNGYQAIYLAWNFQYTGTTDAEKDAVLGRGHELAGTELPRGSRLSRAAAPSQTMLNKRWT